VRTLVALSLVDPQTDYTLPTTAAHQSLEHPNHVESLLSLFVKFSSAALSQVISVPPVSPCWQAIEIVNSPL
jgi:hypothetical protein